MKTAKILLSILIIFWVVFLAFYLIATQTSFAACNLDGTGSCSTAPDCGDCGTDSGVYTYSCGEPIPGSCYTNTTTDPYGVEWCEDVCLCGNLIFTGNATSACICEVGGGTLCQYRGLSCTIYVGPGTWISQLYQCDSGGGGGRTPGVNITINPALRTIYPGDSTIFTVSIAPINGYRGTANLDTAGTCPANATCAFNPSSVSIADASPQTSILTITTNPSIAVQNYTVSARGTDSVDVNIYGAASSTLEVKTNPNAVCDSAAWRDIPNSSYLDDRISLTQDSAGVYAYSPKRYIAWPQYSGGAYGKKCTFGLGAGICFWQDADITRMDFSGNYVYAENASNIFMNGNLGSCGGYGGCSGPVTTLKYSLGSWTDMGDIPKPWGTPKSVVDKDGRTWNFQYLNAPFYKVQYKCTEPSPTVTLSGSPNPVTSGSSSTLSWSSTNATSCTASVDWSGSKAISGSESTGALTSAKTYTLTCAGPGGSASQSVTVNVTNNPPTVGSGSVTEPDYCSSFGAYVNWTYSDPEGNPQSAYQVQIDDLGSAWNVPYTVDTGKVSGSGTSYFATGLAFDITYKARVRVWDSFDNVSAWKDSGSWKTPKHAYPYTDFTYAPSTDIPAKQPVQFTDTTTFYDGGGGTRVWPWLFGDGGVSTLQNPSHTYNNPGLYQVSLTATDKDNYSCSRTKPLTVAQPVPVWKEVSPR